MDFGLSDEQVLLKESVERFVRENHQAVPAGLAARGDWRTGYSQEKWAAIAEMGWLALPFAEEHGGLGGTPVDTAVLMEALGPGLMVEPLLSTVLLGGRLVELLGDEDQKRAMLPAVIEGRMLLALACTEPQARADLNDVETVAKPDGDGFVVSGYKSVVLNAETADKIIVVARTAGGPRDRDGLSMFIIDRDAPGITLSTAPSLDGQSVSDVKLEGVKVAAGSLLGPKGRIYDALEEVVDLATIAVCANAVGAMFRVTEITQEYTAGRKQFGKAVASNQVIQHRLVDMSIAAEEAKAISDMASMMAAEKGPDWKRLVAATKAKISVAGLFVGEQGVQLHGGMGMTNEYPIGHYYKKLMMAAMLFGDEDHQLRRLSALEP